jgi:hypothetical protein
VSSISRRDGRLEGHAKDPISAGLSLRAEDGWLYFVHRWTQIVAQVLQVELTPDLFRRLEQLAAAARWLVWGAAFPSTLER